MAKNDYLFEPKGCLFNEQCKRYGTTACQSGCLLYVETWTLQNSARIPKRYRVEPKLVAPSIDLDSFKKLNDYKLNVVSNVKKGKSILLHSNVPGNGKTSWSLKIANEYIRKIAYGNGLKTRVLFINTSTFLLDLKDSFNYEDENVQAILSLLPVVDLVIWDDFGITQYTDWEHSQLYRIINERYNEGLANIFTTNVRLEVFANHVGLRLNSRIKQICENYIVEFKSNDKRLGGN